MDELAESECEGGHHEGKEEVEEEGEMLLIFFVVGVPAVILGGCHVRPPESSCSVWM